MTVGDLEAARYGDRDELDDRDVPVGIVAGAAVCVALGVALRTWGLGSHDLTFDEAFTGAAAARGFGYVFSYLRSSDAHPPLDYLLRAPLASAGDDALLRLPATVWSLGTLVVLGLWLRTKGMLGALALMVASFLPFLVLHGREARMYSLVAFLGVVVGLCAERWLERPSRGLALGVAAGTLLASLAHSAALVPLACLMVLPGVRRDAEAWFLRMSLVGAAAVWGLLWGPAFLDQLDGTAAGWIPFTSGAWTETVAASLLSPARALVHISAALLLVGGALLAIHHRRLALVAFATFWLPFVVIAVLGLRFHVLLPRSFAFGIWVPVVSLAAGLEELRRRLRLPGLAVGVALIGMVLVPASIEHVRVPRERHVALDELRSRLRPGDRISISPAWFAPVIEWEFAVKDGFVVAGEDGASRFSIVDPSAPASGRTHLLDHARLPLNVATDTGTTVCAPRLETYSWVLRCREERS